MRNLAARFARYDLLSDAERHAIDAERMLPVDELRRILNKLAAGYPITSFDGYHRAPTLLEVA